MFGCVPWEIWNRLRWMIRHYGEVHHTTSICMDFSWCIGRFHLLKIIKCVLLAEVQHRRLHGAFWWVWPNTCSGIFQSQVNKFQSQSLKVKSNLSPFFFISPNISILDYQYFLRGNTWEIQEKSGKIGNLFVMFSDKNKNSLEDVYRSTPYQCTWDDCDYQDA